MPQMPQLKVYGHPITWDLVSGYYDQAKDMAKTGTVRISLLSGEAVCLLVLGECAYRVMSAFLRGTYSIGEWAYGLFGPEPTKDQAKTILAAEQAAQKAAIEAEKAAQKAENDAIQAELTVAEQELEKGAHDEGVKSAQASAQQLRADASRLRLAANEHIKYSNRLSKWIWKKIPRTSQFILSTTRPFRNDSLLKLTGRAAIGVCATFGVAIMHKIKPQPEAYSIVARVFTHFDINPNSNILINKLFS